MGFAKGYVKGKVYALGVGAVMVTGMVLLIDSGYCGPDELEVGDKLNCLYTTRPVSAGEALDMEMLELRETTVETPGFQCVQNILGIKGEKFAEDTDADTMLRHNLLSKNELDQYTP